MSSEAFKKLTKLPGHKITTDYLYKVMNDGKISFDEIKTVDTDNWQKYQKYYAKNLSDTDKKAELEDFIQMIFDLVNKRKENLEKITEDHNQLEDGGTSRRSSRLVTKKGKNYSEETENQNLYILMELINLNPSTFDIGPKTRKRSRPSSKMSKQKQSSKLPSSFGKKISQIASSLNEKEEKKKSSILSFKKANIQTHKIDSESDNESKDSLDINIGKFVKKNTEINKRIAKDLAKQDRSISYLQNARGISKQSSIPRNFKNDNKMPSNILNAPANFHGSSIVDTNLINDYPITRNKTKIFGFGDIKFTREESDPAFRPNVFNEANAFNTADHYFGFSNPIRSMVQRKNTSNVSGFNPFRDKSNPSISPKLTPSKLDYNIPALRTENLRQLSNVGSRNSSIPLDLANAVKMKSDTASFGILTRRSNKNVSQPVPIKSTDKKHEVNVVRNISMAIPNISSELRSNSKPNTPNFNLRNTSRPSLPGAFTNFKK